MDDMNDKRVLFPNDDGTVSILMPVPDCGLTLEQIIAKDVPAGKPYKIVDVSEIPEDGHFWAAWEWQDK
jgi:hypothetical protein